MEINGKKIEELNLELKGNTLMVYDETFNKDLLIDAALNSFDKSGKPRFAFYYRVLYALLKERGLLVKEDGNEPVSFDKWLENAYLDMNDIQTLMQIINESPRVQNAKKK